MEPIHLMVAGAVLFTFGVLFQLGRIEMTLAELKAKVDAETTVVQSAVTLLSSLAQSLKDAIAANDPAAIQAIADELDTNTASLAAAVAANTPAA